LLEVRSVRWAKSLLPWAIPDSFMAASERIKSPNQLLAALARGLKQLIDNQHAWTLKLPCWPASCDAP
jgi:hypothetical protein